MLCYPRSPFTAVLAPALCAGMMALPGLALATSWRVPSTAEAQSDLLTSLLEISQHVVLARIDSTGGGMARATAIDYIKGSAFPGNQFRYRDYTDPTPLGANCLLFLDESETFGLDMVAAPFKYEVKNGTISISYLHRTVPWPAYRDSLQFILESLQAKSLAATATRVFRGTVVDGTLLQSDPRARGNVRVSVYRDYAVPQSADSGSVLSIEAPGRSHDTWYRWLRLPRLRPGMDVLVFADVDPGNHLTFHRDLYGLWQVEGDSARVSYVDPRSEKGSIRVVAREPLDTINEALEAKCRNRVW